MKRILSIAGLGLALFIDAQTLTSTENYIYSKTCLDETCTRKSEAVQYADGFGRSKQAVSIGATPSGKDVVQYIEYDAYDRQAKDFLPVPQPGSQGGAIYASPLSNANAVYGSEKIYAEKIFQNDISGQIKQVIPTGNAWASHPLQFAVSANTEGDKVRKITAVVSWVNNATFYTLNYSPDYSPNQLSKTVATDGDGNVAVEFKNGSGKTILVRRNDGTKTIDTYYVYDEFENLAYVIPPLASADMSASVPLAASVLDDLCYQYHYDSQARMVEKKLPGKGWQYSVYDQQDRLIMVQDTNLNAKNQWLFTKYDQFGRTLYTGITVNTGTRAAIQNTADLNASNPSNNEVRTASASWTASGLPVYYSNTAFPDSVASLLSVSYYDTYPQDSPSRPVQVFGKNTISDNPASAENTKNLSTASYIKNVEDDNWTRNWVWYDSKLRAIGTYSRNHLGGYTKTETEFDFSGAVKQSRAYHKRLEADTEKVVSQFFEYDTQNRLLVHKHQIDTNPVEILAQNEYNELSQLKKKKVGGNNPAAPLETMDYTYNIKGSLTGINDPAHLNGKLFGYKIKYSDPEFTNIAAGKYNGMITETDWKNASENVLKRYTYAYDGLNRLKDAIYSEPDASVVFNNNYNENLTYDGNGNIKTLKRNAFPVTGATPTVVDDLEYQYTGNRLDKIIEKALNDTGYEGGNNLIDYDLNGNMTTMKDKGIQNIAYNYLNLSSVMNISQPGPFGKTSFTLEYLYRADGTKLRKTSTSGGKGNPNSTTITDYLDGFQYTYNDSSICLWCKTSTAYEEQAYKNSSKLLPEIGKEPKWNLDFVATAEGVYSFTENRYIYQYRDHLGNTRVTFAKNSAGVPEITDTNNYYPLGLNHTGGNGFNSSNFGSFYSYKYNGKELQETGMYDYGARMYMSDIGRWGVIDPLAETSRRFSPYHYASNNPVNFIDPDGKKAVPAPYEGMENHILEGSLAAQMGAGTFNPHQPVPNGGGGGADPSELAALGYGKSSKTFGQTQAFRDIMTYLAGGGPKFQFPKGQEAYYKNKYPAFYNLVKNTLPKILSDKNFLNAFIDITGMSEGETRKAFTYGQGPTISEWESSLSEGQYDYAITKYKGDLNSISVEMNVLDWFENTNKDPNTIDGLVNLSYMTSLIGHEGSHWGNNITGPGNLNILNRYKNLEGTPEHGRAFEFRILQSIYPEARPGGGLDNGNYNNISKYLKAYVQKNFQTLSNIYQ